MQNGADGYRRETDVSCLIHRRRGTGESSADKRQRSELTSSGEPDLMSY